VALVALFSLGSNVHAQDVPPPPPAVIPQPTEPTDPCQQPARPGSSTVTMTSGNVLRSAVLHVPSTAAGHRLPLLIALHGFGGNGAAFERDTGFSTIADRDDFAVLYPSALGVQWAIAAGHERDVDFVSDLLEQIEGSVCIDPRRVYATGVSNGGGMAARLGCDLTDRFAAIAVVAGGYRSLGACNPTRPVSLLEIHGTNDGSTPYDGSGPQHAGAVLPYVFGWATRDRCTTGPRKRRAAPHTIEYRWTGCAGGTTVDHLRVYGATHGFPGAPGIEIASRGPRTISGPDRVWRFLAPLVIAPKPDPDAPR
jgi:polyhydroxybutyrate depolymerase